MKSRWIPDENYKFPASGKRNLKFQRKWLNEFNWLAYSQSCDGALCQYCVLFCPTEVGKGSSQRAKSFVTQPYTNWKDAKENFRKHADLNYHKDSVTFAQNFIDVQDKKIVSISDRIDTLRQKKLS